MNHWQKKAFAEDESETQHEPRKPDTINFLVDKLDEIAPLKLELPVETVTQAYFKQQKGSNAYVEFNVDIRKSSNSKPTKTIPVTSKYTSRISELKIQVAKLVHITPDQCSFSY